MQDNSFNKPGVSGKSQRGVSLHQRILSDIEGRILSGEWQPGHRIPFEHELTEHYNCSRMTVNKVLVQLVRAGLVERRKKSGTFVSKPRAQSAILDIHDIKDEVRSLNLDYSYSLHSIARRLASEEDMTRLGLAKSYEILDLTCVHFAGGEPFCLEERLINLSTVPQAADFKFQDMAPGQFLIAQIPWTAAQHRIQAVPAGIREKKLLALNAKHACLVIERQTWAQDGAVTSVKLTYPGNRHVLTAQFRPSSQ